MDAFASKIETLEHRWMRAWIQGDRGTMKSLASREFIFLMASTSPAILDRASWLESASSRIRCQSYLFGGVYVRRHGSSAVFSAPVTLEARLGEHDLNGEYWLTDLWARTKVKRSWRLVERVLSKPDANADLPPAIRSMQLWR